MENNDHPTQPIEAPSGPTAAAPVDPPPNDAPVDAAGDGAPPVPTSEPAALASAAPPPSEPAAPSVTEPAPPMSPVPLPPNPFEEAAVRPATSRPAWTYLARLAANLSSRSYAQEYAVPAGTAGWPTGARVVPMNPYLYLVQLDGAPRSQRVLE